MITIHITSTSGYEVAIECAESDTMIRILEAISNATHEGGWIDDRTGQFVNLNNAITVAVKET